MHFAISGGTAVAAVLKGEKTKCFLRPRMADEVH
jgi:hypothetical protein